MKIEEIKEKLKPIEKRYGIDYDETEINIHEPAFMNIASIFLKEIKETPTTIEIHTPISVTVLWKNVDEMHTTILWEKLGEVL
jgi:hypothetical protein